VVSRVKVRAHFIEGRLHHCEFSEEILLGPSPGNSEEPGGRAAYSKGIAQFDR
jgi:hypothetical protein